jgi:hypothetical protein
MIEAKNAEMKQAHGLEKADSVGVVAMRLQSYFTAFVVNVKRIVKLVEIETTIFNLKTVAFSVNSEFPQGL